MWDQQSCFAIVVSRFNELITDLLLAGACATLKKHGVPDDNIDVARCPGGFEVPLVARKLAASGRYSAVICLACVIRGDTSHYDHVCDAVASGIQRVSLDTGVPVIFGVLTTDSVQQAFERAGSKAGNRGADASVTALEMVNLLAQIPGSEYTGGS